MIKLDDEKNIITYMDGNFIQNTIPIIAFDNNEKFLSLGETQKDIHKKSPAKWERMKKKAQFCNPFLINTFHPKLAGIFINNLAYSVLNASSESQNKWLKDSVELQIIIPDYEKLSRDTQELFEHYIQKSDFVSISSLSINGYTKPLANFAKAIQEEQNLKSGYTFTLIVLFGLAFLLAQFTMGEKYSAPIPEKYVFFVVAIVILAGTIIIYSAGFVSFMMWKINVKDSLSDVISNAIMEDVNILPKSVIKFLRHNLLSPQNGG